MWLMDFMDEYILWTLKVTYNLLAALFKIKKRVIEEFYLSQKDENQSL